LSGNRHRDAFLEALEVGKKDGDSDYIKVIQGLPEAVSTNGTRWLQAIVDDRCRRAAEVLPGLNLFGKSEKLP